MLLTFKHAVVATGFPYDRSDENLTKVLATLKNVLSHVRAIRRLGSAALDMYVILFIRVFLIPPFSFTGAM